MYQHKKVYFFPAATSSSFAKVAIISAFLTLCLSSRRFLASLTLVLLASARSVSCFVLAFSAFFLWMNSIKTRLFLNTLPLARPSLMSLRMFCLELALAISFISLGSNQTLFLPHFITEEASLFCNFSELILYRCFRLLHETRISVVPPPC